ncbi:hypothetical protein D6829_00325 [Candidatus Pacearchaeota archaeon]|nr:MAG: hypothetical protein D6829_00325 [Candidatus Pacearchaeota archaeon]
MSSKFKATFDDSGNLVLKDKSKIKEGRKSRGAGARFEARVRADLESRGWIVDKWSNNVDLEKNQIVPAKKKFNPFSKVMSIGTGFPDFVCFQKNGDRFDVIGVEVKTSGRLKGEEKEKCRWYLKNEIFREILIAKKLKEKNRIRIEYINFLDIQKGIRK